MTRAHCSQTSIAIIGAGIIGLSCALEFARRGQRVTVYEKTWPPRGASWAAAGMIAPAFEAIGLAESHSHLFELCDASAQLWPAWAAQLEEESGHAAGFDPDPTLAIALNEADAKHLGAVQSALQDHKLAPQFCTQTLSEIEPTVTSKAVSGLLLPSDGQVDNRLTLQALIAWVEQHDLIHICEDSPRLNYARGKIYHPGHAATLLTAGWQSGEVMLNDQGRAVAVQAIDPSLAALEPIGGQMLAVAPIENGPRRTIRSGHIYIVPKADRIVIGATSEPGQVLTAPHPEQIAELRTRAIEICPILANAPVLESWAGVRPGFKNHAPVLGQTRAAGLYVATGHYRNGILLAPLTAKIMADLILEGDAGPLGSAFAPQQPARV